MIRRFDRTAQLMKQMEEATGEALKTAALKLKEIARQMVSRKYVPKPRSKRRRQEKTEEAVTT
jgi:hypothetical protein